jgi:hypothetical protein
VKLRSYSAGLGVLLVISTVLFAVRAYAQRSPGLNGVVPGSLCLWFAAQVDAKSPLHGVRTDRTSVSSRG